MSTQKEVTMEQLGIVKIYGSLGRVENPSVEEGDVAPKGWTPTGNAFWTSETARIGSKSLLIDVSGESAQWEGSVFDIVPGETYTLEAYVKGEVVSGSFKVAIKWYRYWGIEEVGETQILINQGVYSDWTQFITEGVAPSDATTANIVFSTVNSATGKLYADDLQIYTQPYNLYMCAAETVAPTYVLAPNKIENNAHACVYFYRVKRKNPLKVYVTFNVTEESKVDVYDAELRRTIFPAQIITQPTTFEVDWDGQGLFEPRVMQGAVDSIQLDFNLPRLIETGTLFDWRIILAFLLFIGFIGGGYIISKIGGKHVAR